MTTLRVQRVARSWNEQQLIAVLLAVEFGTREASLFRHDDQTARESKSQEIRGSGLLQPVPRCARLTSHERTTDESDYKKRVRAMKNAIVVCGARACITLRASDPREYESRRNLPVPNIDHRL